MVVWQTTGAQDGSSSGLYGRCFDPSGSPKAPEFVVNSYSTSYQTGAAIAATSNGSFVIVWTSDSEDGSWYGVYGQRFSGSCDPLGPEFRANTYTTEAQGWPAVAADLAGNFVVVWGSFYRVSYVSRIHGRRFAASGQALGPEFRIDQSPDDRAGTPRVSSDAAGNFV